MSVFALALDRLFIDPNLSVPGLWRGSGEGPGQAVQVVRVEPRQGLELGGTKLVQDAVLLDVRASEAGAIAEGDTIEVEGVVHRIQAPPTPMMGGLVLRLDVLAQ